MINHQLGHLITLTQFLFISIKGFIQETKFGI